MSFKKPFKAVPLKPRARRSAASNIARLTGSTSGHWGGLLLPISAAVAAGLVLGWAWSGEDDAPPVARQGFVSQGGNDHVEALRQREAAEPPETLSATVSR